MAVSVLNLRIAPIRLARHVRHVLTSVLCLVMVALAPAFAQTSEEGSQRPKIVVLGDSLVAGYGLAPGDGFPEQLTKKLRSDGIAVSIENAGVSGDTSSGGLARLDWSVGEGTDGVILELGANDALRGISPEATRENLDQMIERLIARDIAVLLAGMRAPPNMGEEYEAAFNRIYPELAEKHGIALYPFFLDGVAGQPELNQSDGIHPTREGVDLIVEKMLPAIKAFIQKL